MGCFKLTYHVNVGALGEYAFFLWGDQAKKDLPQKIGVNYFPFGSHLNLRSGGDLGRYGFQNQEVDNEIKGNGNSVNYKYRMHDPRVGRFFAVDPLAPEYPYFSPYSFSGNNVISAVELEGLEPYAGIIGPGFVAGMPGMTAIFNSSSIYHGQRNPSIGILFDDGNSQVYIRREMMPFELGANANIIQRNNHIPRKDHGSVSIPSVPGETEFAQTCLEVNDQYFIKTSTHNSAAHPSAAALTRENGIVPFVFDNPNSLQVDAKGNSFSGTESIEIPIAKGANLGSLSINHVDAMVNGFTLSDQNGVNIPLVVSPLAPLGVVGVPGIAMYNIPPGTTSLTLTVTGVDETDRWTANLITSGPISQAGTVESSDGFSSSGNSSRHTEGILVIKNPNNTSKNNPINE